MYSYIIVVRYTMNFDLTEEAKKQLDYMIARRPLSAPAPLRVLP